MSTPLVVALNVLNVLAGGELPEMGKHTAPEKPATETRKETRSSDRYYRVAAPKCPHGHFMRYAVNHCKKGCAK